MGFDLPRSPRSIRFDESVRAQPSPADEDLDTHVMQRGALTGLADTRPRERRLPVPHFRSKDEVLRQRVEPLSLPRRPKPLADDVPLGVWLVAAMLMGIASFHLAPQARAGFEVALRHLDAR
ncbi:MAG: hypothetical protein JWP97_2264 [Labilithrix sp.]|nr:hypothetical protein [Labilithrix sp.]